MKKEEGRRKKNEERRRKKTTSIGGLVFTGGIVVYLGKRGCERGIVDGRKESKKGRLGKGMLYLKQPKWMNGGQSLLNHLPFACPSDSVPEP